MKKFYLLGILSSIFSVQADPATQEEIQNFTEFETEVKKEFPRACPHFSWSRIGVGAI